MIYCIILQDYEKTVVGIIEQVQQCNTSILKYNDEQLQSCVLFRTYYSVQKIYTIKRETPAGKNADLVLESKKTGNQPAFIVELKCDH